MIQRKEYLNKLISWRDKDVIKVISGIRRCGKSTLLALYGAYLIERDVEPSQILSLNFEEMENAQLLDKNKLHEYVLSHRKPGQKLYVFLDEIQNVPEFERCVDSLYVKKDLDIYITGSNAYFLSGELATLLSGRYITVEMLPLSFAEYVGWTGDNRELMRKYREYTLFGSFPYIPQLGLDEKRVDDYLSGIYNTIVLKDVCDRYKFVDTAQLQSILRYCYSNISNITSSTSIANTMTSGGRKIDSKTVEKYLTAFTSGFLLYEAKRYDIKGKQHLKTLCKYYAPDVAIRYMLLGRGNTDAGYILENVVYLELLRRGFHVSVGKVGDREVDFVAEDRNGITYYQVAASVRDKETLKREIESLDAISDHFPKVLLTLDEDAFGTVNGIKIVCVLDWLLETQG
jgi:predicted AAA+ superfamily ATPase